MTSEPYLLTPGPLTTSMRTRQGMLRDWGSWDVDFNTITGRVRERLLQIIHGAGTHECVPMQGSGTFSVEAAIGTLVPRTGHVLVPQNGAYCQRIARICRVLGRKLTTIDYPEDTQVAAADVERALASDPSITHVALVHCEPTTGILNPLPQIAQVVARHGDRKSTRLNSSHSQISYAVFCLKKKKKRPVERACVRAMGGQARHEARSPATQMSGAR